MTSRSPQRREVTPRHVGSQELTHLSGWVIRPQKERSLIGELFLGVFSFYLFPTTAMKEYLVGNREKEIRPSIAHTFNLFLDQP